MAPRATTCPRRASRHWARDGVRAEPDCLTVHVTLTLPFLGLGTLQVTVASRPAGPRGPGSPCGPAEPLAPASPLGPCVPCEPATPSAPGGGGTTEALSAETAPPGPVAVTRHVSWWPMSPAVTT